MECSGRQFPSWGAMAEHAAFQDDLDALKRANNNEPSSINWQDQQGFTPLMSALMQGSVDCVRYLLDQGADVTKVTNAGRNALHMAQGKRLGDLTWIIDQLVEAGADPNQVERIEQRTPLHGAVYSRDVVAAQRLMMYGAKVDVKDRKGVSLIDEARRRSADVMLPALQNSDSGRLCKLL